MKIQEPFLMFAILGFFATALTGKCWGEGFDWVVPQNDGLDWVMPQNHFNGVSYQGNLSYWKTIGSLDLGNDLNIPLNINFSSGRSAASPYLGKGWLLALLESNVVQINGRLFSMVLPDGLTIRFKRQSPTDATMTGDGGRWRAQIAENKITAWDSTGWTLVFTDGKISTITTPEYKQLSFNYQNGAVKEIDEDFKPVLTVVRDSASGIVSGLSFNGKQIFFEQGKMPIIEDIAGQKIVGEIQSSLEKVTLADGLVENYKFSTGPGLNPTLDISGVDNRSFTWDAVSKNLLRDGEWVYAITPGANPLDNAKIERSNKTGKSEYWYLDRRTGVETIVHLNGNKTIQERFTNAGPLSNEIRSEKTYAPDGTLAQEREYSYNESGDLIRKVENFVVVDDDGKRKTLTELTNY